MAMAIPSHGKTSTRPKARDSVQVRKGLDAEARQYNSINHIGLFGLDLPGSL